MVSISYISNFSGKYIIGLLSLHKGRIGSARSSTFSTVVGLSVCFPAVRQACLIMCSLDDGPRSDAEEAVSAFSICINMGCSASQIFQFFWRIPRRYSPARVNAVSLVHSFLIGSHLYLSFLSYTIDVYRGEIPASRNPIDFLLYVVFSSPCADRCCGRRTYCPVPAPRSSKRSGCQCVWLCCSLVKKASIADQLAQVVQGVFRVLFLRLPTRCWLIIYAFAFQIYGTCRYSTLPGLAINGFELWKMPRPIFGRTLRSGPCTSACRPGCRLFYGSPRLIVMAPSHYRIYYTIAGWLWRTGGLSPVGLSGRFVLSTVWTRWRCCARLPRLRERISMSPPHCFLSRLSGLSVFSCHVCWNGFFFRAGAILESTASSIWCWVLKAMFQLQIHA